MLVVGRDVLERKRWISLIGRCCHIKLFRLCGEKEDITFFLVLIPMFSSAFFLSISLIYERKSPA